jgi:hypothetical protein
MGQARSRKARPHANARNQARLLEIAQAGQPQRGWDARLVLAGVWSYVEDNGVGLDNPTLIAAELLPFEEQTMAVGRVSRALDTLSYTGHIDRYKAEVEGTELNLIGVCDWPNWQRPDKPSSTHYPQSDRVKGIQKPPPRDPRESPASDSPPGDRSTEVGDRSAETTGLDRGTYVSGAHAREDDPDADYAADYRDWCSEDERAHLEALADRNVREAYDR